MVSSIDITKVLFLDIETVSEHQAFADLPEAMQGLWAHKAKSFYRGLDRDLEEDEIVGSYTDKAGIYAEFGKIVCISVGALHRDKDRRLRIRLKSFGGDDEKAILEGFAGLLSQYYNDPLKQFLCGHNIKEFDAPYACRRMVVNQLPFPRMLDIAGKKPWETKHLLDTMEMWKFGDRKSYSSLKLLAATLGFPSPKDDIDGSEVGRVYWEEKDIKRIAHYCEKDVLATAQLFLRYQLAPLLEQDQIEHVGL